MNASESGQTKPRFEAMIPVMATITKRIEIDAAPETVWAALADFGAVHERLAPGFVVDAKVDTPTSRVVTFAGGLVAREILVTADPTARRLVYSAVGGRLTHHNASAQVLDRDGGRSLYVWTADILPDALAPVIDEMMTRGAAAMKSNLEAQR